MESASVRTPTLSRFRLSAAYLIAYAASASIHGGFLPKVNGRSRINGFECAGGIRVAFHGAPGAYSEFSAKTTLPGCKAFPCRAFSDAISAVERSVADRAFLPVESTMDGNALCNYELLLRNDLHVVQEMSLFVNYCLLAVLGSALRSSIA